MAYHAAQARLRTLLVDADFGLSNIGILLNLERRHSVEDVLERNVSLADAFMDSRYGFSVLPSAYAGKVSLAMRDNVTSQVKDTFNELRTMFDVVIVDAGTGIHSSVLNLNHSSDHTIVMSSLDPHSVTDSYAQIKLMSLNQDMTSKLDLVITRSSSPKEATKTAESIISVATKHIGVVPHYLGFIPEDDVLANAVLNRNLSKMFSQNCLAHQAWCQISHKLIGEKNLIKNMDTSTHVRRDPDEGTSQAV